ncbi:MAG: DUF4011 domain-containing protein [Bacteroidaceae bacterium]|nr:DUF4011 domain-containing protein [Bacteroidaceae bacterium]
MEKNTISQTHTAPSLIGRAGGESSEGESLDEAALQVDERQLTRQALWERKLLDFSLRNNLLNTRFGKRALQLTIPEVGTLEDAMQSGENFTIQPNTEQTDIPLHKLATRLTAAELKPVLTHLYRGARTALEENGANSLFIAIGMLKWFVTDKSDEPRLAPILLLPVSIVRNGASYVVRLRDEETILNITLVEFLRQQYKLLVPAFDTLPKDENGVDVTIVFETFRKVISEQSRWEVLNESVLGLFSFNKFVMWNDIHSNAAKLQQSAVVRSLVERRLTLESLDNTVDVHDFDLHARPADVATPISVDSSQLEAVIESGEGKSFILYGPPGTGKSQTITNMIANALYQGKRVLFVAEKMAALQVVQKRLAKIGLDPFCLELHSNKVTKAHFLEQLQQALDVTHGHLSEDFQQRSEELYALRQQLNGYMQSVHAKGACGLSVYDCIERYLQLSEEGDSAVLSIPATSPLFGRGAGGEAKTAADLDTVTSELTHLDAVFQLTGHPMGHPLTGLAPKSDRRDDLTRLEQLLQQLKAVPSEQPAALAAEWASIQQKWFLPRFFATKTFLKRLQHIDASLTKDGIQAFIADLAQVNAPAVSDEWLRHKDEWREWFQWSSRRQQLIDAGWQTAVDFLEAGHSGAETAQALARTLYKEWALTMIDADAQLRQFSGLVFEDVIARYRQLTEHFQALTQKELYCRLAARIPSITFEAATGSEVNILKRNIANGGRGTSIRHLIDQIPNLLPKLCPCMLMSPISVAQFIDLDTPKFDLVIFDEASQMPTAEAVGAIGRGKALIVVGDNKQMPPTNFFDVQQVDDEDADLDDLDSILDDCQALSMPDHYLAFHYRSKHESLIAFSNQEYYDGRLYTFPSADDRLKKVSMVKVDGVYDKGGKRSNRAEAEAVVKEIIRRLSDAELSQRSIGVVAFSMAQQNLIEDVLMEALVGKPELEARAFQCEEPIFIKNLENVQGDERDVILFSIGYGPDKDGNVSMNFGPLNNRGGERRLNVAVSRARYEMMVFSTLRAEQIDLRRSQAAGVEGLQKFLKYADSPQAPLLQRGELAGAEIATEGVAPSIAEALNSLGYETALNVGRSKFKVDVAVVDPQDPNRYLIAILIDNHARLATKIARDRELTQPSVLQGLGWKVLRVWSVDWLQNRQRVLDTIVAAIETRKTTTKAEPLNLTSPKIVEEKAKAVKPAAVTGKDGAKRDIDDIPDATIDKAVLQIVKEQIAIPLDGIKLAANRMLGYQRRTTRIDNAITRSVARLIASKQVLRDGETIKVNN